MRPPSVNSLDALPPKKATQLIASERARLAPATTAACAPALSSSGSCTRSGLSTDRLQAASAPSTTISPVRTTNRIRMVVLPPSEGELEREGRRRRRRELISSGSNEANSLLVQRQRLWNDTLAKALVARGMNRTGIGACTVTSRSLKKSSGMNQTSERAFL